MDKIYNIKYVDASYTYTKSIDHTKLFVHEAYGYMKRNNDNIIITFIKKKLINGTEETAKGLVIPDTALISKKNTLSNNILLSFKTGKSLAVTWKDIVIFDSGDLRNDCPIMYTEGILYRIEKDHIVLKDPETIRIYPNPIKNHPVKKPNFYTIPKSLIIEITAIKKIL